MTGTLKLTGPQERALAVLAAHPGDRVRYSNTTDDDGLIPKVYSQVADRLIAMGLCERMSTDWVTITAAGKEAAA